VKDQVPKEAVKPASKETLKSRPRLGTNDDLEVVMHAEQGEDHLRARPKANKVPTKPAQEKVAKQPEKAARKVSQPKQ
jgi:hypothetical protein